MTVPLTNQGMSGIIADLIDLFDGEPIVAADELTYKAIQSPTVGIGGFKRMLRFLRGKGCLTSDLSHEGKLAWRVDPERLLQVTGIVWEGEAPPPSLQAILRGETTQPSSGPLGDEGPGDSGDIPAADDQSSSEGLTQTEALEELVVMMNEDRKPN